jgi:hypothetical protein
MWNLGSATLDKAVTVKLTRTLAILPITLVLALVRARRERAAGGEGTRVDFRKIFPFFILYFAAASLITTAAQGLGVPAEAFAPVKELSKFLIVLAMAAIGLNSNIVKLVRTGRQTPAHRRVLLGRHHRRQPAAAACPWDLVRSAGGERPSGRGAVWNEKSPGIPLWRYPGGLFVQWSAAAGVRGSSKRGG